MKFPATILFCVGLASVAGPPAAANTASVIEENRVATEASVVAAAASAHAFLERLCDDFGGRLTGSVANRQAMQRLAEELRRRGLEVEWVPFRMAGWERGRDEVIMVTPHRRVLRVAALAYAQPHRRFSAPVVSIGQGRVADYPAAVDVKGSIGLLDAGTPLQMRELARGAHERGLRALLFINREDGGQLLARTGSFTGEPLLLPVYSVTQEEGRWIRRLLARGERVQVEMETRSRSRQVDTANLVVRLPGRTSDRVIVGAHFDSWDLGQGALDNGLGVAQLLALATLLKGGDRLRTVELVWFNGEEQGLRGSLHQAARLRDTPVVAMLNLDMVGVPIAVNALGDDSLIPALERWQTARGERRLPKGVQSINWFGSDHSPYQLAGVRTITFNAPIDRAAVRYYHDYADTIDKVPVKLVTESTTTVADLVRALADDAELTAWRRSPAETKELFLRFDLERRMRGVGLWPPDW